ncbi:MAG: hypothetical protein L0H84_11300 [Pseudonocardia sp.]|nr:hypothetical protein [Pseudonocardia sp.]
MTPRAASAGTSTGRGGDADADDVALARWENEGGVPGSSPHPRQDITPIPTDTER